MRAFGRSLLVGWLLLLLMVFWIFVFPNFASRALHSFAPYIQVIPMFLMIASLIYAILRLYRLGMRRPPSSVF
jgi:hypothetical protein